MSVILFSWHTGLAVAESMLSMRAAHLNGDALRRSGISIDRMRIGTDLLKVPTVIGSNKFNILDI